MVVDLYVKAAHGKAQREWPFISCSDHRFTEVSKHALAPQACSIITDPSAGGVEPIQASVPVRGRAST
jgi:hypothetical protein